MFAGLAMVAAAGVRGVRSVPAEQTERRPGEQPHRTAAGGVGEGPGQGIEALLVHRQFPWRGQCE
jgi:hypothetical protein